MLVLDKGANFDLLLMYSQNWFINTLWKTSANSQFFEVHSLLLFFIKNSCMNIKKSIFYYILIILIWFENYKSLTTNIILYIFF